MNNYNFTYYLSHNIVLGLAKTSDCGVAQAEGVGAQTAEQTKLFGNKNGQKTNKQTNIFH